TVIIAKGPAPSHTIKTGPRAILGSAFATTRYGSKTFENVSEFHRITAIKTPAAVPNRKPATVSQSVVNTCVQRLPSIYSLDNVAVIRPGLLNINGPIHFNEAAASHTARKTTSSIIRK